jgi:hypothetical protein
MEAAGPSETFESIRSGNEGTVSSLNDVDTYVIIGMLLDSVFKIIPLYIHGGKFGHM